MHVFPAITPSNTNIKLGQNKKIINLQSESEIIVNRKQLTSTVLYAYAKSHCMSTYLLFQHFRGSTEQSELKNT